MREQRPPQPAQPAPADDAPLYQAERARLQDESAHLRQPVTPPPVVPPPEVPPPEVRPAEEPGYQPPPIPPVAEAPTPPQSAGRLASPGPGERMTQAGLPRRVPRANLAPGMVATESAGPQPQPSPASGGRSPEEVRSMLSSYRTGIERGRSVAGGSDPGERPPNSP
jgi:hypothetical protein